MMRNFVKLTPPAEKLRAAGIIAAVFTAFLVSVILLNLDMAKFVSRLKDAGDVLSHLATLDAAVVPDALLEMLASLCLAVSALIVGFFISLALSFLAAENTAPSKLLAAFIKGGVALVRAVPALVWILMMVASLGFGNTSGMVGLLFPTCGYLTKSFVASIEDMGREGIEAMRTVGARWPDIVLKGIMPELVTSLMSWTAIRMEHNIAESINLGMVGVGGIGALLMKSLGKYDYGAITTIVLVIFLTMLAAEMLVTRLRNKFKTKL